MDPTTGTSAYYADPPRTSISPPDRPGLPHRISPRVVGLDALRGFALCGIIFVNIPVLLDIGVTYPPTDVNTWLNTFVHGRFFPIFSLLFGVGFGMLWHRGWNKSAGLRLSLLRRIVFLGLLGGAHQLLHPGEALLPYAICGLVLLLPATFLPRKPWSLGTLALLGVILLAAASWRGGGVVQVPGLFLIGYTLGMCQAPARIASSPMTGWLSGGIAALGIGATILICASTSYEQRQDQSSFVGGTASILMSITYVATFVTLLHTPIRNLLVGLFSPLGKMALTNYIVATLLMVVVEHFSPRPYWVSGTEASWISAMFVCVAILAVQWIYSTVWLSYFQQGPLEKVWRIVTWWRISSTTKH